jgi:ABC-2 type transport system ATP-binding protein
MPRTRVDALSADAVVIDGVRKAFEDRTVVDGLTLRVPFGTILGLIGPSGAGKTTTVRLLTGSIEPDSGEVVVLGDDPASFRRETRERIGYLPQSFRLYPDLTARENVDFVGSLYGLFYPRRRRRTRDVLELVDLWPARGRRTSDLSGGMQRRLALACALVHDPALLLLDEPTAGLDPLLRARVWTELQRMRDQGRTLLVTTQHLDEAEACDRVALIAEGRLLAMATPTELRRQAYGGDRVEIETQEPVDRRIFADLAFVHDIRQLEPTRFSLVVDDVGTAVPAIVEVLGGSGIGVVSSREDRPTFDEVFARLVLADGPAVADERPRTVGEHDRAA